MKPTIAVVATFGIASAATGIANPASANTVATAQHALARPASMDTSSAPCHRKPSPAAKFVDTRALDAVQFVSGTTGWVAGANRILATTDSGAHWSVQRSAPKADYTEIDAIGSHHVWIVGHHSLIRTANGGRSWQELPETCPVISSVHFVSRTDGFAVAGGKLLETASGGERWARSTAPARVQSVCFTDKQRGWLGAHGSVYRTSNAGQSWSRVITGTDSHRVADEPLAEVQCAGADAGWAELVGPGAGASQQQHVGYYLSDAGSRAIFAEQYFQGPHSPTKRESPGAYFGAFSAVSSASAVFVDTCAPCGRGTSPMVIATHEGHKLVRAGRVHHLNFADGAGFASTSDGWVVGETLHSHANHETWKIEHTSNSGKTWTTQYVE
jgi:photosystem II stability/assembly factor-like uncharacterized protein